MSVITSYSIHYTKLYDVPAFAESPGKSLGRTVSSLDRMKIDHLRRRGSDLRLQLGRRITSYNVCYTKLLRFTFKVTEWRVSIRRRMNEADTAANQKAIDSLLNFETVKYFGAETREAARYDASMEGYEKMAVKTGQSLARNNFV